MLYYKAEMSVGPSGVDAGTMITSFKHPREPFGLERVPRDGENKKQICMHLLLGVWFRQTLWQTSSNGS